MFVYYKSNIAGDYMYSHCYAHTTKGLGTEHGLSVTEKKKLLPYTDMYTSYPRGSGRAKSMMKDT